MKNPKVGDRVIVKFDSTFQGKKGTIYHIDNSNISNCVVDLDDYDDFWFSQKQLRRLVPPKPKVKPHNDKLDIGDKVKVLLMSGEVIDATLKEINDYNNTCDVQMKNGHILNIHQSNVRRMINEVKPPEFIYANIYEAKYGTINGFSYENITLAFHSNKEKSLNMLDEHFCEGTAIYKLVEIIPVEDK